MYSPLTATGGFLKRDFCGSVGCCRYMYHTVRSLHRAFAWAELARARVLVWGPPGVDV
jgi:hypothetical protein